MVESTSDAGSVAERRARFDAERREATFLAYQDRDGRQQLVDLDQNTSRLTLGRGSAADIRLDWDDEVSRVHAELERIGDDWVLIDDGLSRNGTYVNGERLSGRRRLRSGDGIRLGTTLLSYSATRQRPSRTTAAAGQVPTLASLSETQRRVLVALCRPYKHATPYATPATNQQIAEELFLSVDAVKTHLRTLFAKFSIEQLPQNQKRARLVEHAFKLGLVADRDL
jgi:pSer/pThr/pTyr-binding forkhead associated (FHA) protein